VGAQGDRALKTDPVDQFSERPACRGDRAKRNDPVNQFSEGTGSEAGRGGFEYI
jgi:hypothetical protein